MSDVGRINDLIAVHTNSTSQLRDQSNDYLGKDMFLKLLVAQMRYQDPLAPMDNSQTMAQLAQFGALEQMNNVAMTIELLNNNMVYFTQQSSLLQGAAMIGKYVSGLDVDGETPLSGTVEAVRWLDGDPKLLIRKEDGTLVELEMYFITHIQDKAPEVVAPPDNDDTEGVGGSEPGGDTGAGEPGAGEPGTNEP